MSPSEHDAPRAPRRESGSSSIGHIPALDGVRGIAILLVLVEHFIRLPPHTLLERDVIRAAHIGWVGVDLFFVLSGFLITRILVEAKDGPGYYRSFYVRRVLRIVPLYYATLLVLFWSARHLALFDPADRTLLLTHEGWYWTYLVNVLIARSHGWSATPGAALHFWSLCIEEQFYLLWPFLVAALSQRRMRQLCIGALGVSLALRVALHMLGESGTVSYVLTPTHIDPLVIGSWVALTAPTPDRMRELLARWLTPAAVAGLLVLLAVFATAHGTAPKDTLAMATLGYPALGVLCAGLLVAASLPSHHPWIARGCSLLPLRQLGRYSYAIYVLHLPLVYVAKPLGFDVPELAARVHSDWLAQGIYFALMLAASIGLALVSWHLLEQPMLRLKRFFPMPERTTRVRQATVSTVPAATVAPSH